MANKNEPVVTLDIQDNGFIHQLANGPTEVKVILTNTIRSIGKLFVPNKGTGPMASATPKITGALRRSTIFQIAGGINSQTLSIRQGAKSKEGVFYGSIVRSGRGPVKAKKAKALRFMIGGRVFFRKSVGPAKANPYHLEVVTKLMPSINDRISQMGEEVTAYLAEG